MLTYEGWSLWCRFSLWSPLPMQIKKRYAPELKRTPASQQSLSASGTPPKIRRGIIRCKQVDRDLCDWLVGQLAVLVIVVVVIAAAARTAK